MNGYNISKKCIDTINELSPNGNILEFGSGDGTDELLKNHNVFSIEHDIKYYRVRGVNHTIMLCPLENGWYSNTEVIIPFLMNTDLILIDGPPREDRKGILNHLNLFRDYEGIIIFDDAQRKVDIEVIKKFCETLGYEYEIITDERKAFAVCRRKNGI